MSNNLPVRGSSKQMKLLNACFIKFRKLVDVKLMTGNGARNATA